MITHKDQIGVIKSFDFGLNAAELSQEAKSHRETLHLIGESRVVLRSKDSYKRWIEDMILLSYDRDMR